MSYYYYYYYYYRYRLFKKYDEVQKITTEIICISSNVTLFVGHIVDYLMNLFPN